MLCNASSDNPERIQRFSTFVLSSTKPYAVFGTRKSFSWPTSSQSFRTTYCTMLRGCFAKSSQPERGKEPDHGQS